MFITTDTTAFAGNHSLPKILIRHCTRFVSVFRQYYESLECYKTHTAACPDIIGSMKPVIDNRKNQVGKECKNLRGRNVKKIHHDNNNCCTGEAKNQ